MSRMVVADSPAIRVRAATPDDAEGVIALDAAVTGVAKHSYWHDLLERYLGRRVEDRFVLIAETTDRQGRASIVGFIIGEVRAWEFGSEPCGWVFAVSVAPDRRLEGVGTLLLDAMEGRFRDAGILTMRTMLSRRNHLLMSFFRSHGLMAGPYIQLEKSLEEETGA